MLSRESRWGALVLLPLLAGALLVMHGLDTGVAGGQVATEHVATTDSHTDSDSHPDGDRHGSASDHGCAGCAAAHMMVACVAVLAATAAGYQLARCIGGHPRPVNAAHALVRAARGIGDLLRPPDPAWVRLAVMRC